MWHFQSQDIKFPMWESWNRFLPNKNLWPGQFKATKWKLWRYVKHKICRHDGPIVSESIWRTTWRKPFCETFARRRAPTAVVYVKPYDEMSQVFKQHKKSLFVKKIVMVKKEEFKKNVLAIYNWSLFYHFYQWTLSLRATTCLLI